jgi:thiol-disulfide isomerase/thioredoxin
MSLLNEQIRKDVQQALADVENPVVFKVFTQEIECEYCKETRELVTEVAGLSDKVSVEVYDLVKDGAIAESLGVDKVPAIAVVGKKDYGIRMFGIPSGYEFGSLIESIKLVSEGESGLSAATKQHGRKAHEACKGPGFHHPYLTVLPASRDARVPIGNRERPDPGAHGRGDRIPLPGEQVQRHGRTAHGDRRDDPRRRRGSRTDVDARVPKAAAMTSGAALARQRSPRRRNGVL